MRVPVYKYSLAEARELDEESLWLESHKANIECKEGIEKFRKLFFGLRIDLLRNA